MLKAEEVWAAGVHWTALQSQPAARRIAPGSFWYWALSKAKAWDWTSPETLFLQPWLGDKPNCRLLTAAPALVVVQRLAGVPLGDAVDWLFGCWPLGVRAGIIAAGASRKASRLLESRHGLGITMA